eukprot:m.418964 g.418964  ORF g.418964 m.418964 type:complete len:349 (+) comp21297_c0_seq1:361-1407(+)
MGQKLTSANFYFYGKRHFTETGWKKNQKHYVPKFLESIGLSGRIFMVTGANSGIGKEITSYLASKGGKVYMVCRSQDRANKARQDIVDQHASASGNLEILIGDVGLREDVVRVMEEFSSKETKLDALVCNAGALLNELTLTKEGLETTFACHLLFGSYLLTQLALPVLHKSTEPRVIYVSSGGMYNTKFPSWAKAVGIDEKGGQHAKCYDGQLAYAYAKRGQVLLAEQLTKQHAESGSNVQFVSCHPGWTDTPGVDAAFGSQKKYLQPLRSMWQGAEGIAWLAVASAGDIESGSFYLDRTPQVKHISGFFAREGSFTKNSQDDIDTMMKTLDKWSTEPEQHPDFQSSE